MDARWTGAQSVIHVRSTGCLADAAVCFVVDDLIWDTLPDLEKLRFADAHCFAPVQCDELWHNCYQSAAGNFVHICPADGISNLLQAFDGKHDGDVLVQEQVGTRIGCVSGCVLYRVATPLAFGLFAAAPHSEQVFNRHIRPVDAGVALFKCGVALSCRSFIKATAETGEECIVKVGDAALEAFHEVQIHETRCDLGHSKLQWKYPKDANRRPYTVYLVFWHDQAPWFAMRFSVKTMCKLAHLSAQAKAQRTEARGGYRKRKLPPGSVELASIPMPHEA